MNTKRNHPNEELLCAYAEGTLDPEARENLERHLAHCEGCLEIVTGLVRETRLLGAPELVAAPKELEDRVKGWVKTPQTAETLTTYTLWGELKRLLLRTFPRYAFTYKFATAALTALVVVFLSYMLVNRTSAPGRSEISTVRGLAQMEVSNLLTPKGEVTTGDELTFRWNTRDDADFYEIAVMDFETGESILRDSSVLPEIAVETREIGLKPGTTYYWMVRYHLRDGRVLESGPQNFKLTE
jgi:hypothetical protein